MERAPTVNPWLGVAEALAVLAGCMAVILVVGGLLALLLAPRVHELTVELDPRPDATPAGPEALRERVVALDLAARVEVRERRRGTVLILGGLPSTDRVLERVNGALAASGYTVRTPRFRTRLDGEALILEHARLFFLLQSAILVLVGGLFILLRVRREPATTALPVTLGFGALTGVVGFACSATIGLVQQALGWSVQEQAWLIALLKDRQTLFGLIPWIVVLVPLAEEVFFRGYFFRFLHQRAGPRTAYLLSATCFSAIHFHLPGLLVYFVVGLIFAWVCRRTASLVAPVVAHVTYNGFALALSLAVVGG